MATIVTRETTQTDGTSPKGSPLTNAEVDTNFINLNDDKVEVSGAIIFEAKAAEALSKGDVVYVSGVSGNTPEVSKADADDASKMPAYGLAEASASLNAAVNVVTFGTLYDLNTSGFSAGDTVYVSTTAGALTNSAPTGESSLIQNIGMVVRSHASAGSIKVGGAGRTNATPNLNDGNVFIGNASNQAVARALTGDDISGGTITSFASTGIDDNAVSTAITIDSSQNTTFAGTITSGDITISEGTPLFRIQDTDGTNQYTSFSNLNGNTYFGSRNDASDGSLLIGGYGGNAFTEFARWSDAGHLTQKNNLIVQGAFTSLGIDDNATSTSLTVSDTGIDVTGDISLEETTASDSASISVINDVGTQLIMRGAGSSRTNPGCAVGMPQIVSLSGYDLYLSADGSNNTIFTTDRTERMRIDSSGRVGIGVSSPAEMLDINEGSTATYIRMRNATSTTGYIGYGTSASATDMTFWTNGSKQVTLDGSGNVGIGTTSPSSKLEVSGKTIVGSDSSNALEVFSSGDTEIAFSYSSKGNIYGKIIGDITQASPLAGDIAFQTATGGTLSERMRIDSSGNVGIGTTAPGSYHSLGSQLVVAASGDAGMTIASGTANDGRIFFADGTSGSAESEGTIRYDHSDNSMHFSTADTVRLSLDSSGNVGIGTTSPARILHVENDGLADLLLRDTSSYSAGTGPAVIFQGKDSGGTTTQFGAIYGVSNGSNSGQLTFETRNSGSSAERMRINPDGRIVVTAASTVSPNMEINRTALSSGEGVLLNLECNNNSGTGNILRFTNDDPTITSGNYVGEIQFFSDDAGAPNSGIVAGFQVVSENSSGDSAFTWRTKGTERMRLDSSGNLLVGTTTTTVNTANFGTRISSGAAGYLASYRDVNGSGVAVLFGGNAGQVYVRGDGDLENTNNNYGSISDERLKSDIVDASSQIDDIMAVQVRSYTLNETGATHIGVVAQELEASGMSGLVKTDDEGMKSVKYSILYMKAIKALQEAVTRIETLEAEVAALKGE